MAEGVGFEPTGLAPRSFQDSPIRPLSHPSGVEVMRRSYRSAARFDALEPTNGSEHFGNDERTVRLLAVFKEK